MLTDPTSFLSVFIRDKIGLVNKAVIFLDATSRQTLISDRHFADGISIACDPVCNLDVPFILGRFVQSTNHKEATLEVGRWTQFRDDSSLAPPSQDFRKQVLDHLAVALRNTLCE
jgi:hypothetical protein